jgi:hypothetical protein
VRDRSGPLHTQDSEPVTITLQALSLVEMAEPVQVRFTLRLREQTEYVKVCECKSDLESTSIPTRHQMDHVSWSFGLFTKITSWKVGLTQNRETMAL